MALFEAILIASVGLILAPGALFYFDVTPKLAALLAGAAALCLMRPRPADRRFSAVLAITLAAAALSTALSSNPAFSLYGSTWRRYGLVAECAVLIVAWFVSQAEDRAAIVRGITIASAAAAVYGIAQYFGWDPILPKAAYHIGEGIWTIVRPPGTLGYVSYFATWLLVGGFLAMSLRSRLGYAAAALCWSAMLLTGTRAAILGLGAGLLLWLWRNSLRPSRRAVAIGIATAAAASAFYFSPAGLNLRSRSRWFAEDRWGGPRLLLWRDSVRMSADRLVFGHGPETFTAEFPRYESAELARSYPDFAHESPHNIFLDALVSQGLPGLLCLAALCLYAWRAADPWLAAAFAAGLVAQQFTAFTIPTALLFYVTAALCVAKPAAPVRMPRFAVAPVAAALLLVGVRMVAADRDLEQTREALRRSDLQAADARYRAYRSRRVPGVAADLWCSRVLLVISQTSPDPLRRAQALQMAAAVGAAAPATADDPFNAWYHLANVRAAQEDARGTEFALRQAVAANPNWFKPHWTLARLLAVEGRTAEALSEAAIAAARNGGTDPEVGATLAALRSAR